MEIQTDLIERFLISAQTIWFPWMNYNCNSSNKNLKHAYN